MPFLSHPCLNPSITMHRDATVCDVCGTRDGKVVRSARRDSSSSWLDINVVFRCAAKLATVSFVPFLDTSFPSK
jgi:hypothetical protein